MTASAIAVIGYALWTLLLVVSLGCYRTWIALTENKPANTFSPRGDDISPFSERLCRAHANCYEFFPVFGGLLLVAVATGATALTDGLAYVALAARVAQSLTHVASTSIPAVYLRFGFFLIQVAIAFWWSALLIRAAMA